MSPGDRPCREEDAVQIKKPSAPVLISAFLRSLSPACIKQILEVFRVVPGIVRIDYKDQYLLIVDETKDQELKKRLRNSYRLLRAARPYAGKAPNRLWHAHDAMFFGNSRDSVGIQLADLCTYFMQRQLLKRDAHTEDESDEFFRMFSSQAICAKPEPEWTEHGIVLMSRI